LQEGKNAERCQNDLQNLDYVYVPKVHWNECSQRVLTTEFIDGIKISETEKLKENQLNLVEIDEKLIKIFSEQIFHSGFVHADPHPGNLLVRRQEGKANKAEIVVLDHGLYEELPIKSRTALCKVWKAVVEGDHQSMRTGCAELGVVEDYRLFCIALTQRWVSADTKSEEKDFLAKIVDKNGPKAFDRKKFNALPKEEKDRIRQDLMEVHDRMLEVFQNVPSHLMLILRNLNTIRSILKDHQTSTDRYRIMARSATRGVFKVKGSLWERAMGNWHQLLFDSRLVWDSFKSLAFSRFSQLISFLGLNNFFLTLFLQAESIK
jgi:aarF domain-containing kinase